MLFPKSKKEVEVLGGLWDELEDSSTDGASSDDLPDDIADVEDDVTTKPLICSETGFRFNIAPRELVFYREMKIPLPRYHSDYRTLERFKLLSVTESFDYQCIFCDNPLQAYYPPVWGYRKVACVECYQREVA